MSRDEWICGGKPLLLLVSTVLAFGVGTATMVGYAMILSMPYGPEFVGSVTVADADSRKFLILGIVVLVL